MQKLEFPYYGNVFLDNGTIALYHFLRDAESSVAGPLVSYALQEGEHFGLLAGTSAKPEHLWVQHEQLFDLLEDLYYTMGKNVYDTYTDKQFAEGGNLYFTPTGELLGKFPKIKTYGFTELLTNDIYGSTRNKDNTIKFSVLKSSNESVAEEIQKAFDEHKLSIKSNIYFNEVYTKITRLEKPQSGNFAPGTQRCYLTGDEVKKLVDAQNISPFLSSSMSMFNSLLSTNDKKISWKALYLSRFAAASCLYQYPNKLRTALNIYFLHAGSLRKLNEIFQDRFRRGLMAGREIDVLRTAEIEFLHNFKASEALGKPADFIGVYETLFIVLYSLRENVLRATLVTEGQGLNNAAEFSTDLDDPFDTIIPPPLREPLSIYFIRAESFANTKRPKIFDKLFNFHYAIGLIGHLNLAIGSLKPAIQSLKILKPSLRERPQDSYEKKQRLRQLERQLRERVLGKMLQGQSIMADMELLFYDCYGYLLDGLNDPTAGIGSKNYPALFKLTESYETLTNTTIMQQPDLQERAIKLGSQVGQGILNYNDGTATVDRKRNAKQGRKYIVALRKARRYPDFLEQLNRVQMRFGLLFSRDFLDSLTEDDFPWVKQFILLSALNQLNGELNPRKSETIQPNS